MPHISFKNAKMQTVKEISKELTPKLAQIVKCPEDWFTFSLIENETFLNNEKAENIIFVTIEWFKREQEIKELVASELIKILKQKESKEIILNFVDLNQNSYFEG